MAACNGCGPASGLALAGEVCQESTVTEGLDQSRFHQQAVTRYNGSKGLAVQGGAVSRSPWRTVANSSESSLTSASERDIDDDRDIGGHGVAVDGLGRGRGDAPSLARPRIESHCGTGRSCWVW